MIYTASGNLCEEGKQPTALRLAPRLDRRNALTVWVAER